MEESEMSILRARKYMGARLFAPPILVAVIVGTLAGCGSSTATPTAPSPTLVPTAVSQPTGGGSSQQPSSQLPSTSPQPITGGTLVMARQQEPDTLNPIVSDNNGSIFTTEQIFEGLVETVPGTLEPQPALASSWDISADGLTYTFHLRQAKFSNGDPVTADDVTYSISRLIDTKIDPNFSFLFTNVKSVTTVDASTVQIVETVLDPALLSDLTLPSAVIVPQKVMKALGEDGFGQNPVGSGPFMLKSWVKGQSVELVRNPNYWRTGQPYLDGITFLAIPDDNARLLKVQSGGAQIGDNVPASQVARLNAVSGLRVLSEPSMSTWEILLNNKTTPLNDKLVRQALNYATPKDVINELVYGGTATIANSMTVQTRFWDKSVAPYPYDIAKAQQLMAQSSSPNGFSGTFEIQAGDVQEAQVATILQGEWAKIGVSFQIKTIDRTTRLADMRAGTYTIQLRPSTAWSSDITDDSEFADIYFNGNNTAWYGQHSWYNSPAATQLAAQAAATVDSTKRQQLYSQLQTLTMGDAPFVPILFAPYLTVVSSSVQGFSTLPTGWWLLREVWLSK
jgi:peptide/nickel transport system substrate-binding protein